VCVCQSHFFLVKKRVVFNEKMNKHFAKFFFKNKKKEEKKKALKSWIEMHRRLLMFRR